MESQKGEQLLDDVKKNSELQLKLQKENFEKIIEKIHENHRTEIQILEEKTQTLIDL